MANPPKPVELKKRQGTYRADRDPSGGNMPAVQPAKPEVVHAVSASEMAERVLAAGVVWLAETDGIKLALLREALEDYDELRAGGYPPKDVREARQEVSRLLSDLGFDPTARTRLGLAEVKAESVLDEMRRRRER